MIGLPKSAWKYDKLAYVSVALAWLIYAYLTLSMPPAQNLRYGLTEAQITLLNLTIVLPMLIIWMIAVHGAVAFKHYATMINGGLESKGINQIANGLLLTLAYFVLSSLVGAALKYFTDASIYPVLVIIRDHLTSLLSLVAFALVYRGSHQLRNVAKFTTWTRSTFWVLAGYAVFAFLFVLEFSQSQLVTSSGGMRTSAAYVRPSVLLFTLILPYLVAWFIGILATINITKYARQVKGTIYRQALRNLVKGLWAVIGFSIVVQLLSFVARYLTGLALGPLLLIVYLLLLMYGLGFFFVRAGAKKLALIETAN